MTADMILSMTMALREYMMVAMSHDVTVPRRVCMSVSRKGYVSLMVVGGEKLAISRDS